ncbi:hypothetical protein BDZ97DRAFT_459281 [Flammula alnicola]|nr:hypothetical protein BDZ97DRAFT_459281 [Flammula alnicola]
MLMCSLSACREFSFLGFAGAIALSMSTLKKVILEILVNNEHVDPLPGLCNELEEIAGKNVLEDLEICVSVQANAYSKTAEGLGRLDEVLGKSGWSALKKVSLDIYIRVPGTPYHDWVRLSAQKQFPVLSSNKTVAFHFEVK